MANHPNAEFNVVICGLGPTGATLANLLAKCGLKVLALEREKDIYPLPRAVHCDDEVMRVLQWIDVADVFSEQVFINRGMRFVDYEGNVLLDWPRPQHISDNGWHPSYRFHQPDLEKLLCCALRRHPSVDVVLGALVEEIVEDDASVTIRYRTAGGAHYATAAYLVGCDGARSKTRQVMNSSMQRLGFEQRWLVMDLLLKRPMPELGDFTLQFCDPEHPATYCRNVGDRRRWEFALNANQDDDEMMRPEQAWQLLSRWITPDDALLERQTIYTFKSEVADTWRRGRLMVAGDAAHLTPPFMGQGMCAGIRDVANLAWKIADVCHGRAEPGLLDTYESERKPHAIKYIETAVELGELVNRMGKAVAGSRRYGEDAPRMKSLDIRLGPGLGSMEDPNRGKLFPQPALASGQRMDDATGYASLLILDGEYMPDLGSATITALDTRDEPALHSVLNDLGTAAVLLRPDRYILSSAPRSEGAENDGSIWTHFSSTPGGELINGWI